MSYCCMSCVWFWNVLSRVSIPRPMNPPLYLPAHSDHETAGSDNLHPQVLWVGIVPAIYLTAFCGFSILTVGQSNEWVELCLCFLYVLSRHAQGELYLLLPYKLRTNKTVFDYSGHLLYWKLFSELVLWNLAVYLMCSYFHSVSGSCENSLQVG
jgi:hypothetical protein